MNSKGLLCWDLDGVLLKAPTEHNDWRRTLTPEERQLYRTTVEAPEWQECLRGRMDVGLLLEQQAITLGANIQAIAHVLHAWYDETLMPDEHVHRLLRIMRKAGWHTVIASNQDTARAAWVKMKLGLDDAVHEWFFSCHLGAAKPDLSFFQAISEKVKHNDLPCVMIDDVAANLTAPAHMGWHTHHFTDSAKLKRFLEGLS
jgi:putative hydrolase of the HAD superfamily